MFGTNLRFKNHVPGYRSVDWQDGSFLKPKEIEIEQFTTVEDGELLLGASSLEFDDVVSIPFNPHKRTTIIIQGDNNSGKSVLERNIIDQLHSRFNRPIVFGDPKLDSHTLVKPNTNQAFNARNARYDIMPIAYPYIKYITPEMLKVQGAWGQKYGLSMKMINTVISINPTMGMNAIYGIFNTEQGQPSARELQKIFLSSTPPQNVADLGRMIDDITKVPPTLQSQYELLVLSKVISDDGVDYPQLLAQNRFLAIEMTISSKTENSIQDVFMNNLITTLIQDRSLAVSSAGKEGHIHEPFTFVLDEASTFAGKGRQTAETIQMMITKYREFNPEMKSKGVKTYGCDVILTTQHMSELDDVIVKESDWLIFPKIGDASDAEMLKLRGFDSVDVFEAMTMDYDPQNYPKLWRAVDKQKNILDFYPLPNRTYM